MTIDIQITLRPDDKNRMCAKLTGSPDDCQKFTEQWQTHVWPDWRTHENSGAREQMAACMRDKCSKSARSIVSILGVKLASLRSISQFLNRSLYLVCLVSQKRGEINGLRKRAGSPHEIGSTPEWRTGTRPIVYASCAYRRDSAAPPRYPMGPAGPYVTPRGPFPGPWAPATMPTTYQPMILFRSRK